MTIFINTRPTNRATQLTKHLTDCGYTVVDLPLLEMLPVRLTDDNTKQLANLIAGNYDVLVVISPTAAELAIHYLTRTATTGFLRNTKVVAVGQATAKVLNNANIETVIPKVASNEGMLELDAINGLTSQSTVMIWRGQGGRKLLIDVLKERDIQVDVVEWYERKLPQKTVTQYQKWTKAYDKVPKLRDKKVSVLISSGEAFDYWQSTVLTQDSPKLSDFEYVVLGSRLADKLAMMEETCHLNLNVKQIDDLFPNTIETTLTL